MSLEIFEDVVSITHHDYAGCVDKWGWDQPEKYMKMIQDLEHRGLLTSLKFVEIVQSYLWDFKDPHMFFKITDNQDLKELSPGFKVRRYEGRLYVTDTEEEKRITKGSYITALDGVSIPKLLEKHQRVLAESFPGGENWTPIIRQYAYCEVTDPEGNHHTLSLKAYEKKEYVPEYSLKQLDEEIWLMRLTDFDDPDAISQLIRQNEKVLSQTNYLIIDVRKNLGGSDTAFAPIVPFLFDEGTTMLHLQDDYDMQFRCIERNCELQIKSIEKALKQIEEPQARESLALYKKMWEQNRGKGFVTFSELHSDERMRISGRTKPERVAVLTDVTCGSAGEIFADVAKRSPKVTVIGRPTAGLNDYANLTMMKWEGCFELWYPTSRLTKLDHVKGRPASRVDPDVYIPWTPDHIMEDVDLKRVVTSLVSYRTKQVCKVNLERERK
ncbi:MAG: peptidase [Bacillaceae bacterium]|nr:peptidase [Bacillaceae bacterium]